MERQKEEWKRQWDDRYLKQVCGFANSEGGILKIGVDDDGSIIGVKDPKSDMKKITDTIANKLSIYPSVDVDESSNVITITVQRSSVPVDLDGQYYIRTGNTTQKATGRVYDLMISQRLNISWSDMPLEGVDITCLDRGAIDYFRKKALRKKIISQDSLNIPDSELLVKLHLMTPDGTPTRAAILLFHPNPEDIIRGASVKVGMFEGTDSPEILYEDYVGGPLITMPDRLYDLISTKYSRRRITYEGLNMVETAPFPDESLRETILNAVMHNNYGSGSPILIRVWENRIRVDDSGGIPYQWDYRDLVEEHRSIPVNPNMAHAFFLAGFVEGWGRGISRIIRGYDKYQDIEPDFIVDHFSFTVILRNVNYGLEETEHKSLSIPSVAPVPILLCIDEYNLLEYLNNSSGWSSREIAEHLGASPKTVFDRKIRPLLEKGLVERTIPNVVRSKNQRYRISKMGCEVLNNRQP